jgi:hypothetical protein
MAKTSKANKFFWGVFIFLMFIFFFLPMVLYWAFGFSLAYPFEEEEVVIAEDVAPLAL